MISGSGAVVGYPYKPRTFELLGQVLVTGLFESFGVHELLVKSPDLEHISFTIFFGLMFFIALFSLFWSWRPDNRLRVTEEFVYMPLYVQRNRRTIRYADIQGVALFRGNIILKIKNKYLVTISAKMLPAGAVEEIYKAIQSNWQNSIAKNNAEKDKVIYEKVTTVMEQFSNDT